MPDLPRAHSLRRTIAWCVLALALAPPDSFAAWPSNPEQNVPLCVTTFSSRLGNAVSDGVGGAIAVWYEDRNGDFDVFARRISSDGTPQWTANGVLVCVAAAGTSQLAPQAVSDGAKGAIVAWYDTRGGALALYAQRIDSLGTRLWGNGGVLVASTTSQATSFSLCADGAGGAVLAWDAPSVLVTSDIYAQRLNASGVQQWTAAGRTVCNNKEEQVRPVVARRTSGTFVVAWEDQRQLFRSDVYAQAYNAAGTALWSGNGIVLANSADNAINPRLVPSGADDCLLFWDADSLGIPTIRMQRVGTTGTRLWPTSGALVLPPGAGGLLAAIPDAFGGAYVASTRLDPATLRSPLVIQRVHDTGLVLFGEAGKRASASASNQSQAVLVQDGAGGVIAAWYDDQRDLAPNEDIFAQRINSLGELLWSGSAVPVCRAGTQPIGLTAVGTTAGGLVAVWNDTRSSSAPDLYAQGVDAQGRLGIGVGVDDAAPGAPLALSRPAPNPLPRGDARFSYTLATREHVQLRVVDASGRMVRVLEHGEREPGLHTVTWDGRANGARLAPGVYLVQLVTRTRNEIRRLVLL